MDPIFVRDILLELWIKPVPSHVAEVMAVLNSLGSTPSFSLHLICTQLNYNSFHHLVKREPEAVKQGCPSGIFIVVL